MNSLTDYEIKEILADILQGFSTVYLSGRICYVKHFGIRDYSKLNSVQTLLYREALSKGIKSYKDQESYIINQKLWLEEDKLKKDLELLKTYKENLPKGIYNLNETKAVKAQIESLGKSISLLEHEKTSLIGYTAEIYVSKRIDEYYIVNSLFKDDKLTNLLYSEEEFKDFEVEEINEIVNIYNNKISHFSHSNLEKCSLISNFFYLYSLCEDNPMTLYGKPLLDVTTYQAELFSIARYFKNIMSQSSSPIPEEISGDPDKIKEWVNVTNKTQKLLDDNQGKDNISTFNMTQEQIKQLKSEGVIDLADELKKNGGSMNMEQMMKMNRVFDRD